MKPKDDLKGRAKANMPRPNRFRIERLEERIAPKKGGGNTRKCTGNCASDSIGSSVY